MSMTNDNDTNNDPDATTPASNATAATVLGDTDVPSAHALLGRAALGALAPSLGPAARWLGVPVPGGSDLPDRTVRSEVVVDASQAAAYARVVGARVGGPVPPLLVHVLGFAPSLELLTGPGMPFPLLGLVHVAQHVTVHAPVHVGDRLQLAVEARDLRPHRAGRVFDVALSAHRDGELVWEGTSAYLRRGRDGDADASSPGPSDPPDRADDALRLDVPADIGRRYARVAGDANPIHLSALSARAFGFPRAIAHGMWTLARVVASLEGRVPERLTLDARFEKPVLLPARTALTTVGAADGWRMALHDARDGDVRHCTVEVAPAGVRQ